MIDPDQVWALLTGLVMETRNDWRRRVTELTGLPFSRARVLRRLAGGPLSLRELAEAAGIDPPAATVAVNDLELRGLVQRSTQSADRRSKEVSLTPAGRDLVEGIRALPDPAPQAFRELDHDDLAALYGVLLRFADRLGR